MNESISVIDSVEILPLESTEINPLITKVRIKVFHLGENRNRSYIDKDTAKEMAKTLRGNPIVARYREDKGDFTDHGEEITINDKGINRKVLTRPYGFVDLNADVWFEDFVDTDEYGNKLKHTYLVTEGMIWNALYEELQETIMDGGRPQSMELDEKTLNGHWTNQINSNYEIFIINDAIITKLCALGEDVEPCFIGASVTPLFTEYNNDSFVKELIELKQRFAFALNSNIEKEGGLPMPTEDIKELEQEVNTTENFSNEEDKNDEIPSADFENIAEEETVVSELSEETPEAEFAEKKDEEEPKSEEEKPEDKEEEDKKKEEEEYKCGEDKKKYELLQAEYDELQNNFALLEKEVEELRNFKTQIDNEKKDELIQSFYMLSDEDKKDVIENKSQYSLEDIEAKLSVICFRKKVDFNLNDDKEEEQENNAPMTYNLNVEEEALPAWVKAVMANEEN